MLCALYILYSSSVSLLRSRLHLSFPSFPTDRIAPGPKGVAGMGEVTVEVTVVAATAAAVAETAEVTVAAADMVAAADTVAATVAAPKAAEANQRGLLQARAA